jgi:hypothetical protein
MQRVIWTRDPLGVAGHVVSWIGLVLMSLCVAFLAVADVSVVFIPGFSVPTVLGLALALAIASLWRLHRAAPEDRLSRSAALFVQLGSGLVVLALLFLLISLVREQIQPTGGPGTFVALVFSGFFITVGAFVAVVGAIVHARRG